MDVDAVVSLPPTQKDIKALTDALHEAGLKGAGQRGDTGDPIGAVIAVEDRFKNRVDLLIGVRGMAHAAFTRTVKTTFIGKTLHVVGVEDFIAMKLFAGGPKDIDDVVGVLKVSRGRVRIPLLKQLAQHYGKDALRRLDSLVREM
jgi:predicted nucleotidyltransferase